MTQTFTQQASRPSSPLATQATTSTPSLQSLEAATIALVSMWQEAMLSLQLRHSATGAQVAEAIDVDRGTAQRLVRISRKSDSPSDVLEQMPGTLGWQGVLKGVGARLGADATAYKNLSEACVTFEAALNQFSGSKAAAVRAIEQQQRANLSEDQPGACASNPRSQLVASSADVLGYHVKTWLSLQLIRLNPTNPQYMDTALVHAFIGCEGRPGATPFALSRYAARDGSPERITEHPESQQTGFVVLQSSTTSPAPSILTTSECGQETVFIEPAWMDSRQSLDVSVMISHIGGTPAPSDEPDAKLSLNMIARHPADRLIMQTFIDTRLMEGTTANFGAFRDYDRGSKVRPWFDRLPEPAKPEAVHTCPSAYANSTMPFPMYMDLLSEVQQRLGWNFDELVGRSIDIQYPITLARYCIEYQR